MVASSHENWRGEGEPGERAGEEIPMLGRLLRAADLSDGSVEQVGNPLTARAQTRANVAAWSGSELQPDVAVALS